jgi:predicted permease
MDSFLQDLRYSLRMIAKAPGLAAIAILTIGIGTGANATVFGFVSALLLRPPAGVVDPQSLVAVYTSDYSSGLYGTTSYPDYVSLRSDATTFAALAAEQDRGAGVLRSEAAVDRVQIAAVTGDYFDLLGLRATSGRLLTESDTKPDAAPAAVIGHGLWQRAFGGDPATVGRPLTLNGRTYTIVGVVPAAFRGLIIDDAFEAWTPMVAPADTPQERQNRGIAVYGRLRPDATLREAQAQLRVIAAALARTYPATNLGTLQAPKEPRPMTALSHTRMPPDFRPTVAAVGAVLLAAVVLVLLIACANVASLLLSRATSRHREMAIRLALGAGRRRLVRQMLTESVLLGIGGGTCGLLFALWTSDILPSFFPAEQARLLDTSVDTRAVTFVAVLSLVSSLLFGLAPALHASRSSTAAALRGSMRQVSDGRAGTRLRRILVAGQVTVAVVLLVSSALLVKSLRNAMNADLGFATREGVIATVELPPADFTPEQGRLYYDAVLDRVRGMAGVQAAGFARTLPLSRGSRRGFRVDGYEAKPGEGMEQVINVVSSGYFEAMQIPVRDGRTFDARDRADGAPVVVVNDLLANRYFGGNAVGRRIRDSRKREFEIVGVVRSHKYLTAQDSSVPIVYYPVGQEYMPRLTLVARVDGNPRAMIEPIKREMQAVNHLVPVFRTIPLSSHLSEAASAERLTATLVGVCGGMALLLASIGVYGVIAYGVIRRTKEIGIRVALGARTLDVVRLVLHEGVGVTGIGVLAGLGLALLAARALGSLTPLYGVSASDPLTYVSVPLILLSVALLAALAPTRRALRVDPNSVLRQE